MSVDFVLVLKENLLVQAFCYMSNNERYFIHNHPSFKVMYHKDPETNFARIVGFEVTANSINHEYKTWDDKNTHLLTCNQKTKTIIRPTTVPQEIDSDKEVVFTYDVSFKSSDIKWASRWDTYLLMNDDQIHWRPNNSSLLCVYVGAGIQIFGMTLVTMIFTLLGFLSPSNRGGLMTAMVLLWVFMLGSLIQNVQRYRVEENRSKNSVYVSFRSLFNLFRPQRSNLGREVFRSSAFRNNVCSSPLMNSSFGAVFIELFFILTAIWLNQFYYIFGFLFIVFIILLVTCAELAILLCYCQLCSEDYYWW
ncbi:Transmembrane 9 superfamily member 7 like [Actinidia chinensis var. chinensis]|uniref:Transmembrane 9 superfamily member n=1 Tax=Actinidia chinensis var. chinensis TaxID=1590841 RepID=A0A2R6Q526_ACTCC|nr:Transmembrane 9 superfamily member 7 like [Actinidia chinensis var. chinensis]